MCELTYEVNLGMPLRVTAILNYQFEILSK